MLDILGMLLCALVVFWASSRTERSTRPLPKELRSFKKLKGVGLTGQPLDVGLQFTRSSKECAARCLDANCGAFNFDHQKCTVYLQGGYGVDPDARRSGTNYIRK